MATQRRILFALESGVEHEQRWGLDLLVIKSHEGTLQLSANTGLLSALVDLVLKSPKGNGINGSPDTSTKDQLKFSKCMR